MHYIIMLWDATLTYTQTIDLDNQSRSVRNNSEDILKEEFQWAIHLGLQAVILPPPCIHSHNYARVLRQLCCKVVGHQQVWVRIHLTSPLNFRNEGDINAMKDGWYTWDVFR